MYVEDKLIKEIVFKNVFNKDQEAIDIIKSIIIENIPQGSVSYIMGIMANPSYEILNIGDYVEFEFPAEWASSECEVDYMIDLGLFKDGYIYGQIKKSDTYGDQFSPYHNQMIIDAFVHDADGQFKKVERKFPTHQLIKIDKSNIKYFKYGSDITPTSRKRMGDL